jgi:aminopeptidase S
LQGRKIPTPGQRKWTDDFRHRTPPGFSGTLLIFRPQVPINMSAYRLALIGTIALPALLVTACASSQAIAPADRGIANNPPHGTWHMDVRSMADAEDNAGRRAHLHRRLVGDGLAVAAQPFVSGDLQGENLIADVGGPAEVPLLLIGAHSDRVHAGRGATDNASGSAVVLALAERLKRRPLVHHRVKVAFWDLEERGLLGAHAYIEQSDEKSTEKPALYINFDVFGWGDTLWMMRSDAAHPLVAASHDAAQTQRMRIVAGDRYPPSDHLAFLKAGWPAVSYSLVGADEIPGIIGMFEGHKPLRVPKTMKVIHTDNDTMAHIDEAAAAKGIDAVEAAIRTWDAQPL